MSRENNHITNKTGLKKYAMYGDTWKETERKTYQSGETNR